MKIFRSVLSVLRIIAGFLAMFGGVVLMACAMGVGFIVGLGHDSFAQYHFGPAEVPLDLQLLFGGLLVLAVLVGLFGAFLLGEFDRPKQEVRR